MLQSLRWVAILTLPSLAIGIPAGMMLGSFAAGDARASYMAGYQPPDAGAELASASAADRLQPAQAAFVADDGYRPPVQRFAD